MRHASCLCGTVSFEVRGEPEKLNICHCVECRKQSGHLWAGSFHRKPNVAIAGEANLNWYAASSAGRRGFCKTCGSFLCWASETNDLFVVAGGAFDTPLGPITNENIFTAEKGDYYTIAADAEQCEGDGYA